MEKIISITQNKQEILNIVEALQLYKDISVKTKYKSIIDDQLNNIGKQLKEQNIDIILNKGIAKFTIGEIVKYDQDDAVIVGTSDEHEFIKVVINQNNKLEIIDVPIVLLNKTKG